VREGIAIEPCQVGIERRRVERLARSSAQRARVTLAPKPFVAVDAHLATERRELHDDAHRPVRDVLRRRIDAREGPAEQLQVSADDHLQTIKRCEGHRLPKERRHLARKGLALQPAHPTRIDTRVRGRDT